MKTSTQTKKSNAEDGFFKRTYKPKRKNILKLKLFIKEEQKDGKQH